MTKIISFTPVYHFGVYEHKVHNRKELSTVRMIVLKNEYNQIIYYTGLEQFSYPYTGQLPKKKERSKAELVYICAALNFIFGHSRIAKIADITAEHVFGFFDSYCNTPKGDSENIMRQQQSLDKCVKAVTNFFANLSQVFPMCLTVEDIMNYEETKANKHSHRIVRRYVPRYEPKRPHSYEAGLLREMPWEAAKRLVELAYIHDPMIAFGIVLQLAAGLRPSCVMNVRREDSLVSTTPGIKFSYIGSGTSAIEIDLTHEYVLRSDGVSVGRIKKERTVPVYKGFIEELETAYKLHLQMLADFPCEEQYMPMFVCRNGKAMTYKTYAERVKRLVYDFLRPELKLSEKPELSAFAHLLDSKRWAPHTLRHCFTVRLALEDLDVGQIQYYRGDTSPESALTYVQGKGELLRKVQMAHEYAITSLADMRETRQGG